MATETKTKPGKAKSKAKRITFYSRSPNLRLVYEPEEVERNERGRVTGKFPPKDIQFENGMYVWDPNDKSRSDWERSEEVLDWLHGNKDKKIEPHGLFQHERGFWERGAAPDEPEPRLADQLDAINEGIAEGDRAKVEEVLTSERDTHNRDVVIDLGEKSLERMAVSEE